MSDDLSLAISRALDKIRDGMGEPNWLALEALLPQNECGGFMAMGVSHARIYDPLGPRHSDCSPDLGVPCRYIFLYKHGITRRYLNIGEDLSCYEYKASMCELGDPV